MVQRKRLGIIGVGAMGGALLHGIIRGRAVQAEDAIAFDVSSARLSAVCEQTGAKAASSPHEAAEASAVLLCVKPQHLSALLGEISASISESQLLISVAAGIRTATIEKALRPGVPIVRAMPNIAATLGVGATGLCAGAHATPAHMHIAEQLLDKVGITAVVEEDLMDAVTAVSGSGPAFVFLFIEAMADAGVRLGLPRKTALTLAAQTVAGAAALVREGEDHPGELKDRVTSPAGATIEGIAALERCGLRHAVIEAVTAAGRKAQELGAN